jgi:Phage endonuclease I
MRIILGALDEATWADRQEWREAQKTGTRMVLSDRRLGRWLAQPWAARVSDDEPDVDLFLRGARCPEPLRTFAMALVSEHRAVRESLGVQRHVPEKATPTVLRKDPYRSDYERRLAAALTRLGIRFAYERARFSYQDARGGHHTYTPDFALTDLHQTYVEVKGAHGADNADNLKMWHVLRQNAITLLLWDAAIIEMVEDMQHASEVAGLLVSTRLAG